MSRLDKEMLLQRLSWIEADVKAANQPKVLTEGTLAHIKTARTIIELTKACE